MSDISIRDLHEAETRRLLPDLLRIDLESFGSDGAWGEREFLHPLREKWQLSLAATAAGSLVAYAVHSNPFPETVHLHRVAVDPSRRATGIGRRILEEAISRCRRLAYRRYELEVPHAVGASPFYEALGFQRVTEEPEIETYLTRRAKAAKMPLYFGPEVRRSIYRLDLVARDLE